MRDRAILQSSPCEALASSPEPGGHSIFVGGFPCQDLSAAGKQAGRKGSRSGLYRQYLAVICSEKPAWIVTENVGHTWRKWVPHLRRSLHRLGYASLPLRVRASDLGAPHARNRVFIVANADGELLRKLSRWWLRQGRENTRFFADLSEERVAADLDRLWKLQSQRSVEDERGWPSYSSWWLAEPDVERVVYGLPSSVDRIGALGNAIVPQIAELIARGINEVINA